MIVGDSVAEFSGNQGENDWFYGYYQDVFEPAGFQLMPSYNSTWPAWVVDYSNPPPLYWTYITPTTAHGNGHIVNFDRTNVEQWAVRRWVSGVDGLVTISGSIADDDIGSLDNGVIGRVFVGDPKDGNSRFDRARFTSVIRTAPVPEPGSFAIFGMGVIGMVASARRQRRDNRVPTC